MCLAIPAKIDSIGDDLQAVVDMDGVKKTISIELVDDVKVGDYVILHVGYALNIIDPDEAEKTLKLFEELNNTRQ